ncbi:hypothetical protein VR010_10015 [Actinomycetaceae bacterium L2_0104]
MEPAQDAGAESDRVAESAAPAESAPENSSGLSPEDIAYMQAVQKKRLIVMVVAGIVLMVLGFLAGRHIAGGGSDSAPAAQNAVVLHMPSAGTDGETDIDEVSA